MKTIKSADIDRDTVLRYFAAGLAGGAGLGATTSAANYLVQLNRAAHPKDDTQGVIKVVLPNRKKPANKVAHLVKRADPRTLALSIMAALAGGGIGYQGVRSAYRNARHNELEKELNTAKKVYLDTLNRGAQKSAKQKQFSLIDKGMGVPMAAWLLGAVASGYVSNRVLENLVRENTKAFSPARPKRVVFETPETDADEMAVKASSAFLEDVKMRSLSKDTQGDVRKITDFNSGDLVPKYGMVVGELIPKVDDHNWTSAVDHVRSDMKDMDDAAKEKMAASIRDNTDKHILLLNDKIADGHHFLARAQEAGITSSLKVLDLTPLRYQKKAADALTTPYLRHLIKTAISVDLHGARSYGWLYSTGLADLAVAHKHGLNLEKAAHNLLDPCDLKFAAESFFATHPIAAIDRVEAYDNPVKFLSDPASMESLNVVTAHELRKVAGAIGRDMTARYPTYSHLAETIDTEAVWDLIPEFVRLDDEACAGLQKSADGEAAEVGGIKNMLAAKALYDMVLKPAIIGARAREELDNTANPEHKTPLDLLKTPQDPAPEEEAEDEKMDKEKLEIVGADPASQEFVDQHKQKIEKVIDKAGSDKEAGRVTGLLDLIAALFHTTPPQTPKEKELVTNMLTTIADTSGKSKSEIVKAEDLCQDFLKDASRFDGLRRLLPKVLEYKMPLTFTGVRHGGAAAFPRGFKAAPAVAEEARAARRSIAAYPLRADRIAEKLKYQLATPELAKSYSDRLLGSPSPLPGEDMRLRMLPDEDFLKKHEPRGVRLRRILYARTPELAKSYSDRLLGSPSPLPGEDTRLRTLLGATYRPAA